MKFIFVLISLFLYSIGYSGEATYYSADGSGTCSFDSFGTSDTIDVAALNGLQFDENLEFCGTCARVVREDKIVVVKIVDKCPGCQYGDLDLSKKSFKSIAELPEGRVAMTWEVVPCEVQGPIQVHVSDCNDYYIALQIRNHPNGIKAVKIKGKNEDWSSELPRRKDNHFTRSKKLQFPLSVMITDVTEQTLTIEDIIKTKTLKTWTGNENFIPKSYNIDFDSMKCATSFVSLLLFWGVLLLF